MARRKLSADEQVDRLRAALKFHHKFEILYLIAIGITENNWLSGLNYRDRLREAATEAQAAYQEWQRP